MKNLLLMNVPVPGTNIRRVINLDQITQASYDQYNLTIHFNNGEILELDRNWSFIIWEEYFSKRTSEITPYQYNNFLVVREKRIEAAQAHYVAMKEKETLEAQKQELEALKEKELFEAWKKEKAQTV